MPRQIVDGETGQVYERGAVLGKGGFAVAYSTKDAATGEQRAIKVLKKHKLSEALYAQVGVEIATHRAASAGIGHRNILHFFGSFEDAGHCYLTLALARHGTLQGVLAARTRLTEPECQFWLPQLLAGLEHLAQIGIAHRDLTPSNMFVDREERHLVLRIADFGLAEFIVDGQESAPNACGTPSYMPPEVLRNSHIVGHDVIATNGGHSHLSDMWAVGISLYQLIVGRTPFETREATPETIYRRVKDGEYAWPAQLPASDSIIDLVAQLLCSDPSDRPSAAAAAAHPFLETSSRPPYLPISCLKMCPKFDVNGRVDLAASQAASKSCRSTANAYGAPLKMGSTKRTKAKPSRQCVLGPDSGGGSHNRRLAAEQQLDQLDDRMGTGNGQPDPWDVAAAAAMELDRLRLDWGAATSNSGGGLRATGVAPVAGSSAVGRGRGRGKSASAGRKTSSSYGVGSAYGGGGKAQSRRGL